MQLELWTKLNSMIEQYWLKKTEISNSHNHLNMIREAVEEIMNTMIKDLTTDLMIEAPMEVDNMIIDQGIQIHNGIMIVEGMIIDIKGLLITRVHAECI